jgi:hypothetical protein
MGGSIRACFGRCWAFCCSGFSRQPGVNDSADGKTSEPLSKAAGGPL